MILLNLILILSLIMKIEILVLKQSNIYGTKMSNLLSLDSQIIKLLCINIIKNEFCYEIKVFSFS